MKKYKQRIDKGVRRKTWLKKKCIWCHSIYEVPPNRYKSEFCGDKCRGAFQIRMNRLKINQTLKGYRPKNSYSWIGSGHPQWKGGRYLTPDGYVMVRINKNKYMREHRYFMEKFIGRKLSSKEHVHHKNRNRSDNRLENLKIISIHKHGRIHGHQGRGIPKKHNVCLSA